jgi:hypothetical protein
MNCERFLDGSLRDCLHLLQLMVSLAVFPVSTVSWLS